ncbi:MAG: M23 family metallopeptidase [Bacteroidales bacterium]|nr:M23 family metallopeptidase [Bacteroidales bacterium]
MAKNLYFFDPKILSFGQRKKTFYEKFINFFIYFCICLVSAFIINHFYIFHIIAPSERNFVEQKERLFVQYLALEKQISEIDSALAKIQYWDDNIYRSVLDLKPISSSVRGVGIGGHILASEYNDLDDKDLVNGTVQKLENVRSKLLVQAKSLDELTEVATYKEQYYHCKPAILPLSPKNYTYISSYFGYRVDPIYGVPRRHLGLDFPAMRGSPVYSTGKGTVSLVQHSRRGYGNEVVVNHGFGFTTRYAHLHKIHVTEGQIVDRGTLIGEVGNTGKSTGPHLHYEVRINNVPVNPKNYFNFDLSLDDYEKIVTLAVKNE